MNHSFDTEIAELYGVDIAIMVDHFQFWIIKNRANDRHYYNGKYWTYNTIKAFTEIFPYWSENQIRRILKKMTELGIIVSDNFNESKYIRTLWYTFTDGFCKKHKSILRNRQMEDDKSPNGSNEIDKSYNGTDTIPDKLTDKSALDEKFQAFWKSYPKKVSKAPAEKSFRKINPDEKLLDTMLSALDSQRQSEQWQKDGGKFIPYPATWLNQERWNDELDDVPLFAEDVVNLPDMDDFSRWRDEQ